MRFFNTRIPVTQLGYNTGGGREIAQDYLRMLFSGNISKRAQIGARVHYPYSKGSYEYQAAKGFSWGLSGSYMGDRYEMQAFFNSFNFLNKENGGITDDLYITDPAKIRGRSLDHQPQKYPDLSVSSPLTCARTAVLHEPPLQSGLLERDPRRKRLRSGPRIRPRVELHLDS